jgi:hypothetical protein
VVIVLILGFGFVLFTIVAFISIKALAPLKSKCVKLCGRCTKKTKKKKADVAEANEVEMTVLQASEHGVQRGSLLHVSSLILQMGEYMTAVGVSDADKAEELTMDSDDSDSNDDVDNGQRVRSNTKIGSMLVANRTASRHWQNVRADASAIAQIIRMRDVADELIHAAEMEQNGRVPNDEEAVDDVEVEYESGEAAEAHSVARPPSPDLQRPPKTVSVCKSAEGETYFVDTETGETYFVDTETGEAMWKLPEDAFITAEGESTQDEEEHSAARLDLGLAPEAPEAPRMRPRHFTI